VTVIVELPLFPGDGDEMVMLVAVIVMPGLVTVTVAFPEEPEYDESPPYAAVMVSVPAVKPSAAVAELTARVAVPVPLAPAVTAIVPTVVVPMVKVTVPATVPPVVELTVAVRLTAPSSANVVGLAASVVVVAAPVATTVIVVTALVET
jgi:hypothetical protein